jgi:hypothetical protein
MGKNFERGMKIQYLIIDTPCESVTYQVDFACHIDTRITGNPPDNTVTAITITIENGQMDGVPWAIVEFKNQRSIRVNIALCTEVQLLNE